MFARHVNKTKSRGKTYYYHRHSGERLPDDPAERIKRLEEIASAEIQGQPIKAGSFRALIGQYKASPDYKALAEKTRKDYGRYLEWLNVRFADNRVADTSREFVLGLRDDLADKPRTADYTIRALSVLLSYALDRPSTYGLQFHPALRVKRVAKPVGYKPWPDNLIVKFRREAPAELRMVMEMALWTGQRGGDCVRMLWSHYDGQAISVAQHKTGERLWIPAAAPLREMLDGLKHGSVVILTGASGRPWKLDHLRHRLASQVHTLGFGGYSLHGLRYNAASRLAEVGCSSQEISAITGHRTLKMIEQYTRGASKKRLADSAIAKLDAHEKNKG